MAGMKQSPVLVPIVTAAVVLAGCGSGAKPRTALQTTISGVGVTTSGPPPKPNNSTACVHRWNGAANASGRAAAKQHAPNAGSALVQRAGRSGYFHEDAGRCLIYFVTPESGVAFVEAAPGRFTFTADVPGDVSANADLQQGGRLHLR